MCRPMLLGSVYLFPATRAVPYAAPPDQAGRVRRLMLLRMIRTRPGGKAPKGWRSQYEFRAGPDRLSAVTAKLRDYDVSSVGSSTFGMARR